MKVTLLSTNDWKLVTSLGATATTRGKGGRARRGAAAPTTEDVLPLKFLPDGAEIGARGEARPLAARARRGGPAAAPAPLELQVECGAGERVVLAVRMPSGAICFVPSSEFKQTGTVRTTRGKGGKAKAGGSVQMRFVIRPPRGRACAARRGLIMDGLKWVAVKIFDKVVDVVVGKTMRWLAEKAEAKWWENNGRKEGLYRVRPDSSTLQLDPVSPDEVKGPAMLFLHGTFSHAQAAFAELVKAPGDFFTHARQKYGDRIYAWNHFSVSKSPETNVRELLKSLPAGGVEFDVITHSRGGLVLRTLVELGNTLGKDTARFKLRRAALVASPNMGTPPLTPDRWEQTLGFVANVLENFEPNPWAMGAGFVADGLVWLASHIAGDLPGLASMNGNGDTITALQESGSLASGSYAALTSNFHPSESVFQKLVDVGADSFFATANDLVVPSEGSWLADGVGALIPADRIGCFGTGGNVISGESVHHLNYFRQSATVDFLKRTLEMPLTAPVPAPLDPATVLPTRTLLGVITRSGATRAATSARTAQKSMPESSGQRDATTAATPKENAAAGETAYADRTLHLLIVQPPAQGDDGNNGAPRPKLIIATYSNARVMEIFPTSTPRAPGVKPVPLTRAQRLESPGHRFQTIIALDERIRQCLEGTASKNGEVPNLPSDDDLDELGEFLFRALFVGDVRRLYDAARSEQGNDPLNIVLTCDIPWISALPWEFAYDPMRRKYLASEDVHFTRGVMAAVPAEVLEIHPKKLRILVVSAQPIDVAELSIDEEKERITHAFAPLTETKLVAINILTDASPAALQEHIMREQVQGRRYDVVHFIGHGEFETDKGEGKLLLVAPDGYRQELEVRPLREMLCARGIHLVFLNVCESGVGFRPGEKEHRARKARGLAQALVEGGLPAVVANQYTVLDSSALAFAERFYKALAVGTSLGEAARWGRIALNSAVDGEAIDWAVPVLYARDPDVRLCLPEWGDVERMPTPHETKQRLMSQAGASRSAKRQASEGRIRVGIADISRYFPQLPQIIARLNDAQSAFELIMVEAAIPLGVWQVKDWGPEQGGKIRYLWAERFAEKLKRHPERLGVHYLICVTNHMMRWDGAYNIYGWWSGDRDNRVMLFSTGGLKLSREGDAAGRTVANAIVQSLAAQICEEAGAPDRTHEKGSRTCPFYYNAERLEESISGVNNFDVGCRNYLKKYVPTSLNAVPRENIVEAFEQLLLAYASPSMKKAKVRASPVLKKHVKQKTAKKRMVSNKKG